MLEEAPAGRALTAEIVKRALVVALLAAFATLIPASQAPSAEHYYSAASADSQSGAAAAPVSSEPAAVPQMSEEEALDAYKKLPLSFIPNEGQTDKAVRYYAQGAGYGFFFTKEGATLSFAEGKGRGHTLALDFLGADPHARLKAKKRLAGEVNYLVGDDPAEWQQGLPTHAELLYGGLWSGIDMAVRGEGGNLKYEFHLKPGASVEEVRLAYQRRVGHLPGDQVRVEIGFFRHEMNLNEVFAAFEHEESYEPFEVTLRGRPEEAEPPSGGVKFSRVILSAIVPSDAPPGVYRCQRLEVETFGGRRIAFDSSTEETWRNWHHLVREEPVAPPSFQKSGSTKISWRNLGDLSIFGDVGSSVAVATHSNKGEIYGGRALRVFRAGPSKTL